MTQGSWDCHDLVCTIRIPSSPRLVVCSYVCVWRRSGHSVGRHVYSEAHSSCYSCVCEQLSRFEVRVAGFRHLCLVGGAVRGGMSDEEDWALADVVGRTPSALAEGAPASSDEGVRAAAADDDMVVALGGALGLSSGSEEDWNVDPPAASSREEAGVATTAVVERQQTLDPPQAGARRRILKRPASSAFARGAQVARAPEVEGVVVQLSGTGRLAKALFGKRVPGTEDALLQSHASMAARCGLDTGVFQRELCSLALGAHKCLLGQLLSLIGAVVASMGLRNLGGQRVLLQPLAFIRWRKYDETPLRLRAASGSGGAGPGSSVEWSDGVQKLLVTEAGLAMVIRRTVGEKSCVLTLACDQPTVLQVLENGKAESIKEALGQLDLPCDSVVDSTFYRLIDVAMTDECASNLRCERARSAAKGERSPRPLLHVLCDAHKIAKVHTTTFSLLRPWDTFCVRLALSVDGLVLQRLRCEVRAMLEEQLVVIHAARPPPEATAHRRAIYEMFLGKSAKDRYRLSVLQGLFNGDVRKAGVVEHYEVGCCTSRAHTLSLMVSDGVQALFPKRFPVMSRSNWTGADAAIEAIGLPAAVHGLLAGAFCRVFPGERNAGVVVNTGVAHVSGPSGPGADAGDRAGEEATTEALARQADGSMGASAWELWREEAADRVQATRRWVLSDAFVDDMVFAQVQYRPQSARMLRQLSLTGERFEVLQQRRLATDGHRDYPVLDAASAKSDLELMREATDLMFIADRWVAIQQRTEAIDCRIFRVSSRMGAAAYELLLRRHLNWPFRLFAILADDGVADALAAERECMLDLFSLSFRRAHAQGGLASEVAKAELLALAAIVKTDTSSTERWHSKNQRRARARVWSHTQDVASLGAHFLAQRMRGPIEPAAIGGERKRRRRGAGGHAEHGGEEGGKPRCAGGGGPWRAFVHVEGKGRKLTASVAAELSARYAALGDEEREFFKELGQLATIAKQQGDLGFGPRARVRSAVSVPPMLADVADGSGPEVGPQGVAPVAIGPARPVQEAAAFQFSRIIADARAARADFEADLRMERDEVEAASKVFDMGCRAALGTAPPPPPNPKGGRGKHWYGLPPVISLGATRAPPLAMGYLRHGLLLHGSRRSHCMPGCAVHLGMFRHSPPPHSPRIGAITPCGTTMRSSSTGGAVVQVQAC